jgi:hypothetical protein
MVSESWRAWNYGVWICRCPNAVSRAATILAFKTGVQKQAGKNALSPLLGHFHSQALLLQEIKMLFEYLCHRQ